MLGVNVLMSDEANAEVQDFFTKKISLLSSDKNLTYGLNDGRMCKLTLFASTFGKLPED